MENFDADRFFQLVSDMRQAQRDYLAVQCPSRFVKAKELERQVDKAVKKWELRDAPRQGNLMGGASWI